MSEIDDQEKEIIPLVMSWLSNHFFDGSRQALLSWVAAYVNKEAQQILRNKLFLEDPARVEAESLLIEFLKTDPTRPQAKARTETRLGRHTDWGKTSVLQMSGQPNTFVNRKTEQAPDILLMSSLLGLAYRWIRELKGFEEYDNRALALTTACRQIHFQPLRIPYDVSMAERLKQCHNGKQLAQLIDQSQGALWQRFDSERDGKLLSDLFSVENMDAAQTQNREDTNGDALLEMIATAAITKGFIELGWQPTRRDLDPGWIFKGGFELVKDRMTVHIQKGFAKEVMDRTVDMLKMVNYNSARGKQPDIVIRFTGGERECYLIGDAKRNQTGEGDIYRRTAFFSMLNDFIAFGHKLGLTMTGDQNDFLNAPIQPCGLLFFKQLGSSGSIEESPNLIRAFGFYEYAIFSENPVGERLGATLRHIEESVRKHLTPS